MRPRLVRPRVGPRHLLAAVVVAAATGVAPQTGLPAVAAASGAGELHAVTPARLLDTRPGDPVGPGGTVQVLVLGRGGVPAAGVLAVALDLTGLDGTAATTLTAYASDVARPEATALHVAPGEAATAGVVVPVGADGRVTLYNAAGSLDLTADVTGWYGTDAAPPGARMHAFAPQPVLDTRTAGGPLGPGETRGFRLPQGTIPRGHDIVFFRVTVPSATAPTRVAVFAGAQPPTTTSLSATPGRAASALVAVPMFVDAFVSNESGTAHVSLDVVGWADTAANGDDGRYRPLPAATRVADTRNGTNVAPGPLGARDTVLVPLAGRGGVPHDASAVLLTVSAVRPAATGTLAVYPAGGEVPSARQVGYAPGRPAGSLVVARLGPGGVAAVRASDGPVHVAVDVHGWYAGAADYVPVPGGDVPGGLVADAASRYAYVTNTARDRVEVVDLSSGTLLQPIPVGDQPRGLDLTPDGTLLYVANYASKDISVVDVAQRRELRRIPALRNVTDIAIGARGVAVLYAVSGYDGGAFYLRLADDFVYLRSNGPHGSGGDGFLAASADREYVGIGYDGSAPPDVHAYDAASGELELAASRVDHFVRDIAISSDGTLILAAPHLVDRVTSEVRDLKKLTTEWCHGGAFSPDDEVLYVLCGGRLMRRATSDLASRGDLRFAGRVGTHDDEVDPVATRDGSRLLLLAEGGLSLVPTGLPYAS